MEEFLRKQSLGSVQSSNNGLRNLISFNIHDIHCFKEQNTYSSILCRGVSFHSHQLPGGKWHIDPSEFGPRLKSQHASNVSHCNLIISLIVSVLDEST